MPALHLPSPRLALLGAAAVALAWVGCRHRGADDGFELRRAIDARQYVVAGASGTQDGLLLPSAPRFNDVEVDHERRPVVLLKPGDVTWKGRVPAGARLHAGLQIVPEYRRFVREIEIAVTARRGRESEVLQVARGVGDWSPPATAGGGAAGAATSTGAGGPAAGATANPPKEGASAAMAGARWVDLDADLAAYAGQDVELHFALRLDGLPRRFRGTPLVAWSHLAVQAPAAAGAGRAAAAGARPRPNIVFILVDTLRRDRLTPYGYRRDTTPEIERRLGAAGTVVENAYGQAPWTIPSVVSVMTGRYPGEVLGTDISAFGIPAGVTPLAERLARLGYDTGGFIANPTLQVKDGFGRGFRTLYVPPPDVEWISKHADELNRHAVPWLAAHQDRPFFLYAHYVDPHDPYANPEIVGNHSLFDQTYNGPVGGDWVHGIYAGKLKLPDPPRDLAHLNALYDTEVHYVDRYVGQLLATLTPEVLANTLVVFTADHGEEFLDHGGWKHGRTLYDELIHVPLLFRWDGHIRAGRRLGGTVRLIDILPTLLDAAGGEADPQAEGMDLLPYLTGDKSLPERPTFAASLAGDPLRAAAVLGSTKLILFNREEPFQPADELQRYLWDFDRARLARVEAYDLAKDPRERHNLAAGVGEATGAGWDLQRVELLQAVIERRLDRMLPGLRLLAHGLPPGARLAGSVRFERPPTRCLPLFLGPDDHIALHGNQVDFDLSGEALDKGLRVEGDSGGILALAATLDGKPLPGTALRLGAGLPYAGGLMPAPQLATRDWPDIPLAAGPPSAATATLFLWRHDATGSVVPRQAHDSEMERRLRALGYL